MKLAAFAVIVLLGCGKDKPKDAGPPPSAPGSGSATATGSAAPAPAGASMEAGMAAYQAKDWARCVEILSTSDKPEPLYNAACCLALDGKRDEAFAMLDRVIAAGFRDAKHLAEDTDLAALHEDPRWAKVIAAAEANVAKLEASLKEPALRKELLALRSEDQAARQAMIARMDKATQDRTAAIDRKTTARMKEIIAKHGWPGKSLVGEDGANAAWLLVQHADLDPAFQKQCLALMEKAVKAGEVREIDYAYLYDRVAVAEGREQRYGTQFINGEPRPIEDAAHVDERRKAIGLGTMAEYKQDMERMYGKPGAGSGSAK